MTTSPMKCAKCDVPLKGPPDAKPDSIVSCPRCGSSDSLENVEREIGEYVAEKAADSIGAILDSAFQGSKGVTLKKQPRAHKVYRFVVDYEPGH